ncbi:MAG: thioesterase family protein [Blastomonas sp.]
MATLAVQPELRHLFDRDGAVYTPTVLATGPWDKRLQSGVVLNALVAHAIEETPCPVPMVTSRLLLDIMKPTLMEPVEVRTTVVREGKRLQLLDVELVQGEVVTARASALRVRIGEAPATGDCIHALPPLGLPSLNSGRSPMRHISETRLESGGLEEIGPGVVWARIDGEIVPGIAISPFVQLAMAADFGSGTSSFVDWRQWSFANVDISLHLARMPEGEWIRIAAQTESAGNGIAIVHSRIADEGGEIGHAHQTLFLDRRGKP